MKTSSKIILGLATIWPVIYLILLLLWSLHKLPFIDREMFLNIHLASWVITMFVFGNYFIYVMNNPKLNQNQKTNWFMMLFFGNIITMIIYWYKFIWKSEDATKK